MIRLTRLTLWLSLICLGFIACGKDPDGTSYQDQPETNFLKVINDFEDHIDGTKTLTGSKILTDLKYIENNIDSLGKDEGILSKVLEMVGLYETKKGPLFINVRTREGLDPNNHTGVELDWAMFRIQQGIIDRVYTLDNVSRYSDILDGAKFQTAKYFPGDVSPPSDPTSGYDVNINCSMPEVWWGEAVMYCEDMARRPTGAYVAPGSIVTISVPPSIVNQGFNIRVGAHSWDLSDKPKYKRLSRVSVTYPITSTETKIANPLGGGIYIEVPYKAEFGVLPVKITNAVRSPFFSARSFDKTSLADWQNTERHHPGPWADFESDKFMMQVPTSWIYNFNDPVTLMEDWDKAMDAVSELFGLPLVRNITVLYAQIDVMIRGDAYYPGYPQSNYPYNPNAYENGNKDHPLLKGPQYDSHVTFHELGHSQLFTKFSGETEAAVNLPYVAVQNKQFGMPLDEAFGKSYDNEHISLDQAAIMWMVTENFRNGKPMDISNSTKNEVRYQHRGYAKYVEIARIFGWDALSKFWSSVQQDYLKGITYPRNTDPTDSRILRMSKAAGADLTPLIHFWGVHPENSSGLKASMTREGIQPSAEIYDMLQHYRTIIPMDNKEFRDHASTIYPGGLTEGNPDYGVGWYYVWAPKYNETHGEAAVQALDDIINLYFPDGRPD